MCAETAGWTLIRSSPRSSIGVPRRRSSATLFLILASCGSYGLALCGFGPLAVDIGVIAIAALLFTGLFFIGPAVTIRNSGRGLFLVLEDTFGTVPAW